MLHHIVDEHEWVLSDGKSDGKCDHGVLEDNERNKPWLVKDSKPHKALRNIILNKRFLNEVHYYTSFRLVKNGVRNPVCNS